MKNSVLLTTIFQLVRFSYFNSKRHAIFLDLAIFYAQY